MNNNKSLGLGRTHLRVLQEIKYRTAELPACCTTYCLNQCQHHKWEVLNTPPIFQEGSAGSGAAQSSSTAACTHQADHTAVREAHGGTGPMATNKLSNSQLTDPEDVGGEVKAQVRWTA